MLPNLQLVLFFVYLIIESFKKILMCRFAMDSIVIDCTTVISNTLNKVADCMELRVVEDWSI